MHHRNTKLVVKISTNDKLDDENEITLTYS